MTPKIPMGLFYYLEVSCQYNACATFFIIIVGLNDYIITLDRSLEDRGRKELCGSSTQTRPTGPAWTLNGMSILLFDHYFSASATTRHPRYQ